MVLSVMPLFVFSINFLLDLELNFIGIPMGTNYTHLVGFFFCYETDYMKSLSRENRADIIESFNYTLRYLDDLLNIHNIYFDQTVDCIYPTELQIILPIPRHLFWI